MAYDRYAVELTDKDGQIYGVMDAEAREEVSDLNSAISGIKAMDMTDYSGTVVQENGKYVSYSGARGDAVWNKLYTLTPENGQIVFVKTYVPLNSIPAFYFGSTAYPTAAQQGDSEYIGYVVGDGVNTLRINSKMNNGVEVQTPEILVSTYAPQIKEISDFIDVLKLTITPTMMDGKYVTKTGVQGSNSSFAASDYLIINDKLTIYSIYSMLGPDYGIVYFDAEKHFISAQDIAVAKAQEVKIAPPENAVYLRFNNYKPELSTESVYIIYSFNAKAYFEQQEQGPSVVIEQVSMARGAYVTKEGIIGRNDLFAVTDLINAEGVTKVYSDLSYDYCVVYYNENKTPIGYQNTGLTYQGYTGWYDLEKPSGTKYLRFSTAPSVCPVNECKVERVLTDSYINSKVEELSYVGADIAMFTDIATCGDSFTRCEMYIGGNGVRSYESSWGKIIGRMKGINVAVYARGGATIKSYLTDPICLPKLLNEDPKQLYILCIGINDYTTTVGTADDIKEDYTQNPDTFCGNYGRLIDQIKAHAPTAKLIICQTFPVSTVFYTHVSDAIRAIAEHYNIPMLDTADSPYLTSENYRMHFSQGHPDSVGQSGMAVAMCELIGKILDKNIEYFSDFYIPDPSGTLT